MFDEIYRLQFHRINGSHPPFFLTPVLEKDIEVHSLYE